MSAARETLISFLTGVIVVLLVVGVAVVAFLGHVSHRPVVATRATPPTPSPPVCPAPVSATPGATLGQLLIPAPRGFVRQPDPAVHGGVLPEARVAADSQQPEQATAELATDGYEAAIVRVWIDAANAEEVQVTLVQFSCASGASEYLKTQAASAYGVAVAEPFVIDGLAGAQGERSTAPDTKGHYLQVVGLVSGSTYAQIDTFTPRLDDGSLAGAVGSLQSGVLAPV